MQIIAQAPAASQIAVPNAAGTVAFNVIAGEPGAGTQCNMNAPGSNRLNGTPFTVRAAGFISYPAGTYTCSTVQVLVFGSNTASFAAATANAVASMTALTAASVAGTSAINIPWEVEVELEGDNTSKVLCGVLQGWASGTGPNTATTVTALARAASTNPLTTFNAAAEPPVQFSVGIVSGGAQGTTGITATLTNFIIEA